jgi:pSer/pThr/pTyr-binding forkhead associated (FHA) protein
MNTINAKLVYSASNGEKYKAVINREETSVGRRDDNQICLIDKQISKYHAIIRREDDGKFYIRDKNSANGVKINGVPLTPETNALLKHEDAVEIGNFPMIFEEIVVSGQSTLENQFSALDSDFQRISWAIDMNKLIKQQQMNILNAKLVYLASNGEKYEAVISREETSVGRRDDNQICLIDKQISKYHAIIWREDDGKFYIRDKNSANGVKINGVPLTPETNALLKHEDAVEIGNFPMIFEEIVVSGKSTLENQLSALDSGFQRLSWAIDMNKLIKQQQKEKRQREKNKLEANTKVTISTIFMNRDTPPHSFDHFRKYLLLTVFD